MIVSNEVSSSNQYGSVWGCSEPLFALCQSTALQWTEIKCIILFDCPTVYPARFKDLGSTLATPRFG